MTRVIRNIYEECDCEWCGWPLDIGDRCHDSSLTESVYCSAAHVKLGDDRELTARRADEHCGPGFGRLIRNRNPWEDDGTYMT